MKLRSPIGLVLVAVVVAIIVGAGVHFTLRPLWGTGNTPGAENGSGSPSPAPGPENPLMTEHKPNALIHESSPYLLQHAYNPVDWMPWGDAAFAKAKAENKIVFLSIGYATCHWCHVMERESFENEEIAKMLNKLFVCIKVDREERPDIDAIYMSYCSAVTGRGGWPLTVWLLPDRRPFRVGTYFPPRDLMMRRGLPSVCYEVARMWETEPQRAIDGAERATDWLREHGLSGGSTRLGETNFEAFYIERAREFDELNGGFGTAPKFPLAHSLSALLRNYQTAGDGKIRVSAGKPPVEAGPESLRMVEETLQQMVRGGIFDQVGWGFHRYSTDAEWLVPHFEKMLYDQALLVEAYLDAYQITADEQYAETIRKILDYVLRDLRDEAGGFYCAEDADSEGVEGKFYVWSVKEMREVLGKDAELAIEVYNCSESGNFVDEATRATTGDNILHLSKPLDGLAENLGIGVEDLKAKLESIRVRLFDVRSRRIRPLLDDKVLTDWNGLMIGAMARAGAVLGEPRYLTAATEAATFLRDRLVKDGRLLHRYRKGNAGINGYASDYAFLANGLFELYQATFDAQWLRESRRLGEEMVRLFFHEKDGLLHMTGRDDEGKLIAPTREKYDGAIPSSNSVGAFVLLRLGKLTQNAALSETAERILTAMSLDIERRPSGLSYALRALDMITHPAQEIVIAGPRDHETTREMIAALRRSFLPRAVIALHEPDDAGLAIEELAPFIREQRQVDGMPAAYVCEDYTCLAPVTTTAQLTEALAASQK